MALHPPAATPAATTARSSLLPSYLALAAGILALAFSPIFVRWAGAPGPVAGFYRTVIAAVALAVPFARRVRRRGRPSPGGLRLALLGGAIFGVELALWGTGVMLSGASNPSLLANMSPLWVGLGALIFFHEKLRPAFWIGLVLASLGAAAVLGIDLLQAPSLGLGSLFGLLAGVFYGAYFLVTQRGREGLDSLSYFWLAAVGSATVLWVVTRLLGQPLGGYSPATYLLFAAMGLLCQVVAHLSINYALGHLPASLVSPIMLLQPLGTVLLAAPLLGERMLPGQALGALALLAGVYVVHRSRERG